MQKGEKKLNDCKMISCRMERSEGDRFRLEAFKVGKSVNELLIEFIRHWMEGKGNG